MSNTTADALRLANQALQTARQVVQAADEQTEEANAPENLLEPSAGRLVDLSVFLKALDLFAGFQAQQAEGGTPDTHGDLRTAQMQADLRKGLMLALRHQEELVADVDKFLVPLMDGYGLKSFKVKWTRVRKPAKTIEQWRLRVAVIMNIFDRLKTKPDLLKASFTDPQVFATAKRFTEVFDAADLASAFKVMAACRPVGGMIDTRRWVKHVAGVMGAALSDFEEMVADVAVAQDLGEQLRITDVKLANQEPEQPEAKAVLEQKREEIVSKIEELASTSATPEAVTAVAATAAASKPYNFMTETGKKLGMSQAQEQAMMVRGKAIIAAGAGSGKTRVLAGKVVYHTVEQGVKPASVLATSFTRKSATELKDRIRKMGGRIAGEAGDGFGTTHSIATKLMMRFRPELNLKNRKGIGPKVKEGQLSQTTLIRIAIKQVLMWPRGPVNTKHDPKESFFSQAAIQKTVDDIKGGGGDPPVSFAEAVDQGLAWLDTSDAQRLFDMKWVVQYLKQNPSYNIVGVAKSIFRELKAGRLTRERLSDKQRQRFEEVMRTAGINFVPGVSASVTAAFGDQQPVFSAASVKKAKKAFSQYADIPANQWFNLGAYVEQNREALKNELEELTPGKVSGAITRWKGALITPGAAYEAGHSLAAAAYAAYEWIKGNDPLYAGEMDGDDVLINVSKLMVSDPEMLGKIQQRFKYVLVDEAQDQNPAQHLMFGLIAGYYDPATQQPRPDGAMTADTYAMIGDDKQAIYEFRGAAPLLFINNSDKVSGTFKTEYLDTNYRSGQSIVEAANRLIAHNKKQIPMACRSYPDKGAGAFHYVRTETYGDAAALVSDQIATSVTSDAATGHYKDFGVATRTNNEAYYFTAQLLEKGIPFRSKFNPLNNHTVLAVLNWVLLVAADMTRRDYVNKLVVKCLKAPKFGISDKTLGDRLAILAASPAYAGKNYLDILASGGWDRIYEGRAADRNKDLVLPYTQALQTARTMTGTPMEVINQILNIKGEGGVSMIDSLIETIQSDEDAMSEMTQDGKEPDREQLELAAKAPLGPILNLAARYTALAPFVDYLQDLSNANGKIGFPDTLDEDQTPPDAVTVDTVHGWKGLEVKHLYAPMAGGTFPSAKTETEDEMESERRLAYVAITRGEDSVTLLAPRVNLMGKAAGISPFIVEACAPDATKAAVQASVAYSEEEEDWQELANLMPDEDPAVVNPITIDPTVTADQVRAAYEKAKADSPFYKNARRGRVLYENMKK